MLAGLLLSIKCAPSLKCLASLYIFQRYDLAQIFKKYDHLAKTAHYGIVCNSHVMASQCIDTEFDHKKKTNRKSDMDYPMVPILMTWVILKVTFAIWNLHQWPSPFQRLIRAYKSRVVHVYVILATPTCRLFHPIRLIPNMADGLSWYKIWTWRLKLPPFDRYEGRPKT